MVVYQNKNNGVILTRNMFRELQHLTLNHNERDYESLMRVYKSKKKALYKK